MKSRKILFILLFPFMAEFIVSCCNCGETFFKHYTNKSIWVNNLDNSGKLPVQMPADSIVKTAFGIRLQFTREETAFFKIPASLFIQNACATSCKCPPSVRYSPKEQVTAIKIFTLNEFDGNHPANSDISIYFKVYKQNSFTFIKEFLNNLNLVFDNEIESEIDLDLLLMTPPTINKLHKFKVQVTFSDGRVLEEETPAIKLY